MEMWERISLDHFNQFFNPKDDLQPVNHLSIPDRLDPFRIKDNLRIKVEANAHDLGQNQVKFPLLHTVGVP